MDLHITPLQIALSLIFGLLSVLLHEFAHFAAARSLGVTVKRFGVSLKGVYIVRDPGRRWPTSSSPSPDLLPTFS